MRTKLILFSLFYIFLFSDSIYSQGFLDSNDNLNFSTISNPDVSNFERYSLKNLNHYTGKIDISIPIFNIETGGISYPISLNYDSGGIKVDQLASSVGLGWNLTKTVITRNIQQANDFVNIGFNHLSPNYGVIPSQESSNAFAVRTYGRASVGYFLRKHLAASNDLGYSRINNLNKNIDFLPDIYSFYTNNFQTNFFFEDLNNPVELVNNGTKIESLVGKETFLSGFRAFFDGTFNYYDFPTVDFFSFTITTNEGIKYTFNDFDVSINYIDNVVGNYIYLNSSDPFINNKPATVSAWHISEIEDLSTGKKIVFEYDTMHSNPMYDNNQLGPVNAFSQRSYNYNKIPAPIDHACSYYINDSSFDLHVDNIIRYDLIRKRLKKIVFESGEVSFNYNNEGIATSDIPAQREDVYNGDYLTSILIKNVHNQTIKTFLLKYDYFVSDFNNGEFNPDNGQFNSYRYKRLKLKEVLETGKNPYVFEYIENIKLPPVNSFSVDFLGYFNNSPDVLNKQHLVTLAPNPQLYFYPNKLEKSLLPFEIPQIPHGTINGYFNREANDFAKAWSLKKIIYPTGGSSEIFYESNRFKVLDHEVIGGGIRVSGQNISDGQGNNRTIAYDYVNLNGQTSGTISSIPFFGHPTIRFWPVEIYYEYDPPLINAGSNAPSNVTNWKIMDKSNLNEDIGTGAFVGYERVVEREVGKGKKEFVFTSNNNSQYKNENYRHPNVSSNQSSLIYGSCIGEFLIANSGLGGNIYTDNSILRGKIKEFRVFDEEDNVLKEDLFEYEFVQKGIFSYFQPLIRNLHVQGGDNNAANLMSVQKKYKVGDFHLINKIEKTFLDGLENQVSTNYFYYNENELNYLSFKGVNFDDTNLFEEYIYLSDIYNQGSIYFETISNEELNAILDLKDSKNNLKGLVKLKSFKNGVHINSKRKKFRNFGNNRILLEGIINAKDQNILELEEKISLVDTESAKPLETEVVNGIKTSYIWGYNKTLIVAKIENFEYNSLPQNLVQSIQTASNSIETEANLLNELNTLRNLPALNNAKITTYTHIPLVGVKTMTDPNGYKTTYIYDENYRLYRILDNHGNIIKEYDYHYKSDN